MVKKILKKISSTLIAIAIVVLIAGAGLLIWKHHFNKNIEQLLKENKELQTAITNLKTERQIGYAKVISQTSGEGKVITKLKFVETIWKLADDTQSLAEYGISAIYGNVVYRKVKPGLVYVFKISSMGSLYPEVIPDL